MFTIFLFYVTSTHIMHIGLDKGQTRGPIAFDIRSYNFCQSHLDSIMFTHYRAIKLGIMMIVNEARCVAHIFHHRKLTKGLEFDSLNLKGTSFI